MPIGITLGLLQRISIMPTQRQAEAFERSDTFLEMAFREREAHQVRGGGRDVRGGRGGVYICIYIYTEGRYGFRKRMPSRSREQGAGSREQGGTL